MITVIAFIVFGSSIFTFLKLCERAADTLSGEEMKRLSSIRMSTAEFVFLLVAFVIAYALCTRYPEFAVEIYIGGVALFLIHEIFSYIRATREMQALQLSAAFMRWFRIANLVALVGVVAFFAMILAPALQLES